jgi:Na+/H+ antiporter NhaA
MAVSRVSSETPPVVEQAADDDRTAMMHPKRTFHGILRAGALASLLLVAAVVVALVWANIGGYEEFWRQPLGISVGRINLSYDLRTWVNSGLMTLFFLAVGLEARRELDLGDLRDRSRLILPITVGLVGMALPVGIYLLINHGLDSARAWGVAMSTDTALALGVLTLLAKRAPKRTRTFLLTAFVVDDVAALIIIAVLYSGPISPVPLLVAVLAFAGIIVVRRFDRTIGRNLALVLGVLMWLALLLSGIDPVVSGLAIGLATTAYIPVRADLERATGLVRDYRESPNAELARSAAAGLADSLSENERILYRLSPWTSYVVVPLFALANAGVAITPQLLSRASTSAVTIGIVVGYVIGKPISVVGSSLLLSRLSRGRIHPQVGWLSVLGSGTAAGVGFTVSSSPASPWPVRCWPKRRSGSSSR